MLLGRLHWLAAGRAQNHLLYKTAVLTFKVRNTATPAYLNPLHTDAGLCTRPSLVQRSIAGTTFQEN